MVHNVFGLSHFNATIFLAYPFFFFFFFFYSNCLNSSCDTFCEKKNQIGCVLFALSNIN